MPGDLHVLGIRHHGPGSARAVQRALDALQPDAVVIEGATELDALVPLAGSPDLVPPVAALVYAVDEPARATFYPFAAFSPEWIALRWSAARGVPVRFADLAATHQLLLRDDHPRTRPLDPIATLATAAGYEDPERWWEDAVEHRRSEAAGDHRWDPLTAFAAISEAMGELRRAEVVAERTDHGNDQREAAMRRVLREVLADHDRVAFVCGAWHAPAVQAEAFPTKAHDLALLKGLARIKVAATFVPWTAGRLARSSGYGAGVTSPGWYAHLFGGGDDVVESWLARVARCLRDEGLPASSAGVIEAVRLAEALAVLRGRPLAGLDEVTEAARAVLCGGSSVPLELVARELVVGDEMGRVPDETPLVPLAADLIRTAKRLRIPRSPQVKPLELDLRRPGGRERSTLFHRLELLDVPWAEPADGSRSLGTFKEAWVLEWRPELEVRLIEASGAGTTVEAAATATVVGRAADADLHELAALVERCFPADLPDALGPLMAALGERSAHQHDTARLMDAVEPLARTCRYGDVRGGAAQRIEAVRRVLDGIVTRVCVGLSAACASLDDEAAADLRRRLDAVHRGVATLDDADLRDRWLTAVEGLAGQDRVHGLVAGRLNRLVLDLGRVDAAVVGRRLSRVLSVAADAPRGAAWLEGFLAGDAALLLHDHDLLAVIDEWVAAVDETVFDDLLPLLRRTFTEFSAPERRQIGEQLRRLDRGLPAVVAEDDDVDPDRGDRVLPRVYDLLGIGPGIAPDVGSGGGPS